MTRLDSLFIWTHRMGFALIHRVARLLVLVAGARTDYAGQLRWMSTVRATQALPTDARVVVFPPPAVGSAW